MKKIISKTIITSLLLTGTVVFAEDSGGIKPLPPKIMPILKEVRQENKIEIKDLKERMASSTSSNRQIRGEVMKKRIEDRFQKMIDRMEATIERETAIMTRIASRIEKIKGVGGKTDDADKLMLDAKIQLDSAKTSLDKLKTEAENATAQGSTATGSSTTKDALQGMKKASQEIEKYLRAGHKDLEKTVGSLRGLSQLRNASTTKSN